jgi:heme-degrading monooxygenase HmoA
MNKINQPYTLGIWTTKTGNEKAFIIEWEAFAKWTAVNFSGAGTGYLLQDREHPEQFISFGPWESMEVIKGWRERPEFKAFATKARELCSVFEPRSFVQVASSEE